MVRGVAREDVRETGLDADAAQGEQSALLPLLGHRELLVAELHPGQLVGLRGVRVRERHRHVKYVTPASKAARKTGMTKRGSRALTTASMRSLRDRARPWPPRHDHRVERRRIAPPPLRRRAVRAPRRSRRQRCSRTVSIWPPCAQSPFPLRRLPITNTRISLQSLFDGRFVTRRPSTQSRRPCHPSTTTRTPVRAENHHCLADAALPPHWGSPTRGSVKWCAPSRASTPWRRCSPRKATRRVLRMWASREERTDHLVRRTLQTPVHVAPGARVMRPCPVRSASAGAVIGSRASDVRRRSGARVSALKA